ncbi:MAG TPA: ATP-binding cassette domain-containing protein [Alphaproteobacteria bacterium]|nr:ATP-binding cassette domain-containing protein [Alphaproteobacteria bacterium]
MTNADLAIRAKGLTKKFGKKTAVDGVNLEVKKGEIYGFLGPNGAGKSTTIRMLVTLLAPTKGSAFIMSKDIDKDVMDVRLKIGVALQEASLDGQQTGTELLRLQGRLYGLTSKELDERVEELKKLVNIGDAIDQQIKTYSGGMKRRLDLAAALIHNPEVLFLDEPTTGLDPVSRMQVWEEIRKLNKDLGVTIFLTTQYLEEADQLCGRLGIISQGKIVAQGTPKELKKKIGEDVVIIHTLHDKNKVVSLLKTIPKIGKIDVQGHEVSIASPDGTKIIGPIALKLLKAGIHAEQLTMRSPTLDDVFFEVTGNRMVDKDKDNETSDKSKDENQAQSKRGNKK